MQKKANEAKASLEKEDGTVRTAQSPVLKLRSIFPDRLVIMGTQTPSGTRYDVTNGQVIAVDEADYDYLRSLTKKSKGCCGGIPNPPTVHLFSEVN